MAEIKNDRTCLQRGHHIICHANPPAYECRMITFDKGYEAFCGCLKGKYPDDK